MRFRLLGASLFVAAATTLSALNGWHAQAQDRGKIKIKMPEVIVVPEIRIEQPEWSVVMPMPVIAPIAIPDINIDLSDMHIEMPDDWFYNDDSERTEREEL